LKQRATFTHRARAFHCEARGVSDHLARFDTALHEPASNGAWATLCELLDDEEWPAHATVMLPRIQAALAKWPAEQRRAALEEWCRPGDTRLSLINTLFLHDESRDDAGLIELLSDSQLGPLLMLDVNGTKATSRTARWLANWPPLRHLSTLQLVDNELDDEGAIALAASPHIVGITKLDLGFNRISDVGAEALATSPHLAGLSWLGLYACNVTAAGMVALLTSPRLPALRECITGTSGFTVELARMLVSSPQVPSVNKFSIVWSELTDDVLAALSPWRGLERIKALNLTHNRLSSVGVTALAAASLNSLEELDLSSNALDDAALVAIANSAWLANVKTLKLSNNTIGTAGVVALANSPHARNLTKLELAHNQLGAAGAHALAQSPHLMNLETLALDDNALGDHGARHLANTSNRPNLRELFLNSNGITDEGTFALTSSPNLTHVKWLRLFHNALTPKG